MRKSIVIIAAVAIIGILGMAAKSHHRDGAPLTAPSSSSSPAATPIAARQQAATAAYKDGTYSGASEFTPYGTVQIAVVVSGGKITNVDFLQMPSDMGHSREVTSFAEPYLKDETIQSQNSNIQFVSGATTTSAAYEQSLQAALDKAVIS
ncbi:MAG TPA: FMN-binding protein [Candidatus Saccharimonadales bacterium]|nr:FMN-binding protein [Candidatus Saccharimonadales bacterium]